LHWDGIVCVRVIVEIIDRDLTVMTS